jgi:aspartate/methionine/tyrosine aminotransferase
LDDMWARHDYTTISTTMLSNTLAAIALSPKVRPQILARTRKFIRDGYPVLEEWVKAHDNTFTLYPSQAAAIAFVRYNLDINSTELVTRMMKEKSVLMVPGDHFGLDNYLRISFGLPHDYLRDGLDRAHDLILNTQA